MQAPYVTNVLVIDEIPLIAVGMQQVFRTIHPNIIVEYSDNVFRALSAREYANRDFQLIILGSDHEESSGSLLELATELKQRFPGSRIMIYTDRYDPALIAKTTQGVIHTCIVHKHEPVEEIVKAYTHLTAGETYVSSIFDTLYYTYRLNE